MRKILIGAAAAAAMLLMAMPAMAAGLTVGNDSNLRTLTDTYSNFAIVDTNHPSTMNTVLTTFTYYAANTNPFKFFVVNTADKVTWQSDVITPPTTGVNTYSPVKVPHVGVGYNVGMYFQSTGTIPFEYGGAPAFYTANNAGSPSDNGTMAYEGNSGRVYSFVAITPEGFDQYGYNNLARIFNGTGSEWCLAGGQDKDCMAPYSNDKLVMKWNEEWDRGNAENWLKPPYNAWTNNEWNGKFKNGSGQNWHYKIVWVGDCKTHPELVPTGAYCVWGQFATIMDRGTDPNLGLKNYWYVHASPNGYGAYYSHQ